MRKRFTVSDGTMVLTLQESEEGGYIVSSPVEPELSAFAPTIAEAFTVARERLHALAKAGARSGAAEG
jgi:predicted RNase H-like HicB family nuclease